MAETLAPPILFDEPTGLSARGTLVVIAGRGESAGVYERLGRRLAADSYRVRITDATVDDVDGARTRIEAILRDEALPHPKVLIGSDAGAVLALDLAAANPELVNAVVVAGLPTNERHVADGGEAELRSACPVHRRTLDDESLVESGALARRLPTELVLPVAAGIRVPVLAIHGEADTVTPLDEAMPYYRGFPRVQIVSTIDGRHDSLNDSSHRSVAASIVLFLERVRNGNELAPVLREH